MATHVKIDNARDYQAVRTVSQGTPGAPYSAVPKTMLGWVPSAIPVSNLETVLNLRYKHGTWILENGTY